jgi:hypothetical protein
MGGIAGLIYSSSKASRIFQEARGWPPSGGKVCAPTMEAMVAAMHYRGLDGHGF